MDGELFALPRENNREFSDSWQSDLIVALPIAGIVTAQPVTELSTYWSSQDAACLMALQRLAAMKHLVANLTW